MADGDLGETLMKQKVDKQQYELLQLVLLSNELDKHCVSQQTFWGPDLLRLLSKHLENNINVVGVRDNVLRPESLNAYDKEVIEEALLDLGWKLLPGKNCADDVSTLCTGSKSQFNADFRQRIFSTMEVHRWFSIMFFERERIIFSNGCSRECLNEGQLFLLQQVYSLLRSHYSLFIAMHSQDKETSNSSEFYDRSKDFDFFSHYRLSKREMDVIHNFNRGMTYQQIANDLFIDISTVRTHVKNIYRKVGVNNQRLLLSLFNNWEVGETRVCQNYPPQETVAVV